MQARGYEAPWRGESNQCCPSGESLHSETERELLQGSKTVNVEEGLISDEQIEGLEKIVEFFDV